MQAHEQGGQPGGNAIERGQIRGALPAAIADQELMLEQQRFCGDGADANRTEECREGEERVNGEEEQFARESNATTNVIMRKTARKGPIPSYCVVATDTFGLVAIT